MNTMNNQQQQFNQQYQQHQQAFQQQQQAINDFHRHMEAERQRLAEFQQRMTSMVPPPNIPPGVAPWMNHYQQPYQQMQPQPMAPWLLNHGYGPQSTPQPQCKSGFNHQNPFTEEENQYVRGLFPEPGYFITLVLFTESRDEETLETVPLTALCKALRTVSINLGKNPQQRYTLSDIEMEYHANGSEYTKEYTSVIFENIPLSAIPYLKEEFEKELKQLVHEDIFTKITSRNYFNAGFHLNSYIPRHQGSKMSIDCTVDGLDWNPAMVRTANGGFFKQSDGVKWNVKNSKEDVEKEEVENGNVE